MKKKLIIGFGLLILIFALSLLFIIRNLQAMVYRHEIKAQHEKIEAEYNNLLFNIKSAQSELYRHQAGYSNDIDSLVENVLRFEDMLVLIRNDFSSYPGNSTCNNCHQVKEKLHELKIKLEQISSNLDIYKKDISFVITNKDTKGDNALEKEASKTGDGIISSITVMKDAVNSMVRQMEISELTEINRTVYLIILIVLFTGGLSLIIGVLTIRSVISPVKMLSKGITRVSAGEYNAMVPVLSNDEIGFLAMNFNDMLVSLNKATSQKEALLEELQELNSSLEKRIKEATEELRLTYQNIARNESLSIIGTFASSVAHEVSTPLTTVLMYIQMLKKQLDIPLELQGNCKIVEDELIRCKKTLGSMLTFAKAPEYEKKKTDINEIITELLTLIKYQARRYHVEIKKELDPDLPLVMAVAGQLRQVLMNVIVNALQSLTMGGEVFISTFVADSGEKIAVSISDTGQGIPASEIGKIFLPFYTNKAAGTGLGLSISYGIIKGHGGEIEVRSEEGRGTTFIIYLPAEAVSADAEVCYTRELNN